MGQVQRISTGRVTADFFAGNYRFSASIIVYKRRLVDVLADRMTDYLDIVDVYISRINNPGDIVATYKKGSLVKDEITLIMLPDEVEGISKERFYTTRDDIPVFFSVPSFEIHGQLKWGTNQLDIKKLLSTDTQKFLALTNATAVNSLVPEVKFEGPMVLVNKSKVQVICGLDPD
jgi:hypothetical protein